MFIFTRKAVGLLATGVLFTLYTGCKTLSGTATPKLIDDNTFQLTGISADTTYGYIVENPLKVGNGTEADGPKNMERYLNALTGPKGETVHYTKTGRCCFFETKAVKDGYGRLTRYRVYYDGAPDTVSLFVNMYDPGNMQAPVGFGFKK